MDKIEFLKMLVDKLSLSTEEVEDEYSKLFEDEKQIHKDLNEEEQSKRALQRLSLYYKKQLRSPAVGFEGVIIGYGDCVDIIAKQKREAIDLFRIDPQTAISEGVTNEEGVPLVTRKEWNDGRANVQYGKPLPENNFIRNVFGVAKKTKSTDEPKMFSMVITGEKAQNENIPIFKPVRFMAIDRSQDTKEYKLNFSQFTNFVIDDKLQLPTIRNLISEYVGIKNIKELSSYHEFAKEDFNRIVVVEGDVSMLNLEPTGFGSRIMVIDDAVLEDIESRGTTCWLPPRINVDFAEGSKVLVVGRTAQGKKKDEKGNATEELGDVTINVYGVYAIPEYKITLPDEIQPITEGDLDIN